MFCRIARIANKDAFSRFQSRNPSLFCNIGNKDAFSTRLIDNQDAFSMLQLRNPRLFSNTASKGSFSPRRFYYQGMDTDSLLLTEVADNFSLGFKIIVAVTALAYGGLTQIRNYTNEEKNRENKKQLRDVGVFLKYMDRSLRNLQRERRLEENKRVTKLHEMTILQMKSMWISIMELIEKEKKK